MNVPITRPQARLLDDLISYALSWPEELSWGNTELNVIERFRAKLNKVRTHDQ